MIEEAPAAGQPAADLSQAPPKGYRPAIPVQVKFTVAMRQDSRCALCGERLGEWKGTEWDHVPAIQLRAWDPEAGDTIPAANDPDYLTAAHADCHERKTTGRLGDSKLSRRGGDIAEINKTRRLEKARLAREAEIKAFRERLLASGDEPIEVPVPDKKKKKREWPKRPFPKRQKTIN
ncbi:hypothetical protein [Methylobacterium indicum]|uniref:HNH endonuclease n=1 Tax=Methylobacterium indicum TaxID=1775910 RepID=A0A8H8X0L0_9HYPH|nr:hypothetical protein [Methylobacterium indicum]BCM87854.1 hypothetical protein mvi_63150 [Methylobacterium indicum]